MTDLVKRLRSTRADMLGTDDEAHYWDCHEAANEIEQLEAVVAGFRQEMAPYRRSKWLAELIAKYDSGESDD